MQASEVAMQEFEDKTEMGQLFLAVIDSLSLFTYWPPAGT